MDATPSPPHDTSGVALAKARTLGEALTLAERWLRSVPDGESAALDAQLLLAHVTGLARTTILAYPERPLAPEDAERYAGLVMRRVAHEPVAYLTGHREF